MEQPLFALALRQWAGAGFNQPILKRVIGRVGRVAALPEKGVEVIELIDTLTCKECGNEWEKKIGS